MSQKLPSYEEAAALVAARALKLAARKPHVERAPLAASTCRVLASALTADADQPAFPRSTRDGYACRAAEINTHQPLPIAGATRAGDAPPGPLPVGSVWEIMTGAPVPTGADAIAMFEHVKKSRRGVQLVAPRTLQPGQNIVARGAQASKGDLLLAPGAVVDYAQIALAASCGAEKLAVFKRPRVAILTTGDEVVPVEAKPKPGQIRNSNAPMLAAMVAAAGGEPWILPTAADSKAALHRALKQARKADLVLVTGGVSAGKFDLVESVLKQLGARLLFTGVRIQPGKPVVFAEIPAEQKGSRKNEKKPCFGLPGNPVSSAVTFLLFAAPMLRALAGRAEFEPRFALAPLDGEPHRGAKSGLTRFLPGSLRTDAAGAPTVGFVTWQGSGDLAALARSNCFIILPPDGRELEPGTLVRILLA